MWPDPRGAAALDVTPPLSQVARLQGPTGDRGPLAGTIDSAQPRGSHRPEQTSLTGERLLNLDNGGVRCPQHPLARCIAAAKACGPGWRIESPARSPSSSSSLTSSTPLWSESPPEAYDTVIATYKNPLVNLLEVGLVGAVLFHALNGLRVIAIDFWSKGPKHQQAMLWSIVVVWMLVMIPGIYFMLEHTVSSIFGGS